MCQRCFRYTSKYILFYITLAQIIYIDAIFSKCIQNIRIFSKCIQDIRIFSKRIQNKLSMASFFEMLFQLSGIAGNFK